jgi:hypothetical protein
MSVLHRRKSGNNTPCPLPLFNWADRREREALSFSETRIARRFRLSPRRARLIAELAGLYPEARHER